MSDPRLTVEHNPSPVKLEVMNVYDWPIWSREASCFPWTYDTNEICYILSGEVIVTPEGGEPVLIKQGDLVYFAAGLSCIWDIRAPLKKHYQLRD